MKKINVQKEHALSLEETLTAFRRKLGSMIREKSRGLEYSMSQMDTMSFIADKGSPSMKEIAKYLNITPPSATAMVETMQKNKLVTRVLSQNDRRTIRVALTQKAEKLLKSFHKIKLDVFTKMLSRLEENERKQFVRSLNILIKE